MVKKNSLIDSSENYSDGDGDGVITGRKFFEVEPKRSREIRNEKIFQKK